MYLTGPKHPRWTGPVRTARILRAYEEGKSLHRIGQIAGVTGACIYQWLKRRGLPTDKEGRRQRLLEIGIRYAGEDQLRHWSFHSVPVRAPDDHHPH